MQITKEVTIYDVETEIDIDASDIVSNSTTSELREILDELHADQPEVLTDWIADNAEHLDLPKAEPVKTLTDEDRETLRRVADLLDALQTVLGMGDHSHRAAQLRRIADPQDLGPFVA